MKKTISILMMASMLYSCGNSTQSTAQGEAEQLAAGIQKKMPGGIPTTAGGWTMTAKINGRVWTANSMMPLEETGRIIGDNNGEGFGFPYDRRQMEVGRKEIFGQHNAVDISTFKDGEIEYWSGYKGEMEITKVEGDWAEGKFFITDIRTADPNKTVEITDGFFRISMQPNK